MYYYLRQLIFWHSINKYLLSICYVPKEVLSVRDIAAKYDYKDITKQRPCLSRAYKRMEEIDNTQKHINL